MHTTTNPASSRPREEWPSDIAVVAWPDPVVDHAVGAIPTASDEALLWWASTLGPSALLIARHLAIYAAEGPSTWPLDELGRTFGISVGVVQHTLDRLVRFGVANRRGHEVAVRLMLPPLTRRQFERLPRYLAAAYGQ